MAKKEENKKIVKITESALADMIENIVTEAVAEKKQEWLVEQAKKEDSLISEKVEKIVESKLAKIFKK